MASIEIITKEDLMAFKADLLNELKILIQPKVVDHKEWIKSREVRKLLGISPGTLQNLRISGKIRFTKVGGTLFYSSYDLYQLLNGGKDIL